MKALLPFLTAVLLLLGINTQAQSPKYRIISVPAERYGKQLQNAWAGGLNSPQFSSIDLNGDGLNDLFVFDRVGERVLTFLRQPGNVDTAFVYAPQYESLFPDTMTFWALLRDYNYDGVPDIFSKANAGMLVYKGKIVNGTLQFDKVSDLVLSNQFGFNSNLYIPNDDIPVITDVDRDGDLDVLTFGIFGSTVEYHKNMTRELQTPFDSLKYEMDTQCWGNFVENSLNNSITLNVSCKGGGLEEQVASTPRHAGSTLFHFDADNDRDIDLLIGDISFPNLVFVRNCGDSLYADACQYDSLFPVCNTPVDLPIFPAAFGYNVDNDPQEDLLVAPNVRAGAKDVKNIYYYHNTPGGSCPFTFVTDSFLVGTILDFGTDSKPVFFDFDYDGLTDIVVGHYGYFRPFQTYRSTLIFLKNIGTNSEPRYRVIQEDYNNFSLYNIVNMHPAFGDLDGDGLADLIVGDLTGEIHYFKNTGLSQANYPVMTAPKFKDIDVGMYSAPFIYDVNNDSLNDLVIGRRDGRISYYWNFGTKTNPEFHIDSVNSNFGQINVNIPGYNEGYSSPFLQRDSTGKLLLYTGSNQGNIFVYEVDSTKLRGGTFNLLNGNFIGSKAGYKTTISIADLNGDGYREFLMGTASGGLLLYSDSLWDTSTLPIAVNEIPTVKPEIRVFPNPGKEVFNVVTSDGEWRKPEVQLYTLLGSKVAITYLTQNSLLQMNTGQLPGGVYILHIRDGENHYTQRMLIQP